MKKFLMVIMCLINVSSFAASTNSAPVLSAPNSSYIPGCSSALPPSDPKFCSSFSSAVQCYCSNDGYGSICSSMRAIYNDMMHLWGNDLKTACAHQKDTSPDTCYTDWSAFINQCPFV